MGEAGQRPHHLAGCQAESTGLSRAQCRAVEERLALDERHDVRQVLLAPKRAVVTSCTSVGTTTSDAAAVRKAAVWASRAARCQERLAILTITRPCVDSKRKFRSWW